MAHILLSTRVVLIWRPDRMHGSEWPLTVFWGDKNPIVCECWPCPESLAQLGFDVDNDGMRWASIRVVDESRRPGDELQFLDPPIVRIRCKMFGDDWHFQLATIGGAASLGMDNRLVRWLAQTLIFTDTGKMLSVIVTHTEPIPCDSWDSVLSKL